MFNPDRVLWRHMLQACAPAGSGRIKAGTDYTSAPAGICSFPGTHNQYPALGFLSYNEADGHPVKKEYFRFKNIEIMTAY